MSNAVTNCNPMWRIERGCYDGAMLNPRPMLEYAFCEPVDPQAMQFSMGKMLALGYVAACTIGLILMGIAMAMQV